MSANVPIVKHDNTDAQHLDAPNGHADHHTDVAEANGNFGLHVNGTSETIEEETKISGDGGGAERLNKKRKLDDLTRQRSTSRAASPPWKKVAVDGPTSVIVDGKRKSMRTNNIPAELTPEPDRRKTRRAADKATQSNGIAKNGLKHNGTRAVSSPALAHKSKAPSSLRKAPSTTSLKPTPQQHSYRKRNPSDVLSSSPTATNKELQNGSGVRSRSRVERPLTPDNTGRKRRSTRASEAVHNSPEFVTPNGQKDDSQNGIPPSGRAPRVKLILRRPELPVRHPKHIPPSKKFESFEEWLKHDDPLTGEESQKITLKTARKEAEIRRRIFEAAQPGGVLSQDRSGIFLPEPDEEPPPMYGHYAHVVAHALNFRKLLKAEHENHKRLAKRMAYEALEKWKEKYKRKTKEELEQEEKDHAILRYKQLVRDVQQQWNLVKGEVDKARLAKWEEEQDRLGKKAMDTMLDHSHLILGRGRIETSSSFVSEDDDDDDDDEETGDDQSGNSDTNSDDENLSSDESDSEEDTANDEDANLTQEQLLAKYGQLPDISDSDEDADVSEDEDGGEASDMDRLEHDSEDDDKENQLSILERDVDQDILDYDEDDASEMDLVVDHTPEPKKIEGQNKSDAPNSPSPARLQDAHQDKLVNGIHSKDGTPKSSHVVDLIDPATVELEEVDAMLLDSDESKRNSDSDSSSEEWPSSEDDSGEGSSPGAEGESDEDAYDTWGLLSKAEIRRLKAAANNDPSIDTEEAQTPSVVIKDVEESKLDQRRTSSEQTKDGYELIDPEADTHPTKLSNGISHQIDESEIGPTPSKLNGEEGKQEIESVKDKQAQISRSRETSTPRTEIPSLLRGKLREYQHDGLDWLANLYEGETNGILADEMGLGKTIQTIALLAHLAVHQGVWGPHLVVVPTSVMLNWEMEFKKWCPGFKILTYYGDIVERQRKRKGWLNDDLYNVCITSYQLILQDASAFKRRAWHYLILDEAHNIKNFKTQRWQTLLNFRTQRRLLLTGTPLQNNIDELWSLLYFLMPAGFAGEGRIAGLEDFSMALKKPTNQILEQGKQVLDAEGQKIVKKLHEVLRPYLLRRMKADVEKQMPGKYEHVVYCRLSKRQRQLYDGFMGRADTKQTLASGNYMSIINCLMSLRKVCNHPDLFETRQIVTSFAMLKSVVADFEIKDLLIRRRFLEGIQDKTVNLDFLNLLSVRRENTSMLHANRTRQIRAIRPLEDLIEQHTRRINVDPKLDGSSINSVLSYMKEKEDISILDHLKNCLRLTRQRTEFIPAYGKGLIKRLNLNLQDKLGTRVPGGNVDAANWYLNTSTLLLDIVPTLEERALSLEPIIQKFGCVTPAVVANDMGPLVLSEPGVELIRRSPVSMKKDPFHEARIRLSIAFPDKRLLQYDCGKLQRLAILLRDLQAGGHRALIFTQMTKVLDILEQFLNIHGHRYLRLDGATKVEQRQILTDRFNTDNRILCFILSSRSGGLGINLTGADTVIFYDLDWNPAMDKQCQDRCHRIGQTRDVHIYKFVSEYTIEANILRKSNQKRLLDDVIIQEGDFTTDYFNKVSWRDAFDDETPADEASVAMDRVLGDATGLGDVLQSVEDLEDATAAKVAQKEIVEEVHVDDADFNEASTSATPKAIDGLRSRGRSETGTEEERRHVDEYMVEILMDEWKNVPIKLLGERSKKHNRKGQDVHRVRRRRG